MKDLAGELSASLASFLERLGAMTRFAGQVLWQSPSALLRRAATNSDGPIGVGRRSRRPPQLRRRRAVAASFLADCRY